MFKSIYTNNRGEEFYIVSMKINLISNILFAFGSLIIEEDYWHTKHMTSFYYMTTKKKKTENEVYIHVIAR